MSTGRLSNGAGDRTRTRNLLITNQLLYQLSHASVPSSAEATPAKTSAIRCQVGGRRLLHAPLRAVKRPMIEVSIAGLRASGSGHRRQFRHRTIKQLRLILGDLQLQ